VFSEIVKNDRERSLLRDKMVGDADKDSWLRLRELIEDRKNLRRSAEEALRWNTDKGKSV
jgi:hypothetical protein